MSKYIDAEKLIAEIEKREYEVFPTGDGKVRVCATPDQIQSGWLNALKWVRDTITSLQQEQQEVDLEKEIEKTWLEYEGYNEYYDKVAELRWNEFDKVARHFYELGKTK